MVSALAFDAVKLWACGRLDRLTLARDLFQPICHDIQLKCRSVRQVVSNSAKIPCEILQDFLRFADSVFGKTTHNQTFRHTTK